MEAEFGADCLDLIEKMLTVDPHKRITAAGVLSHGWITSLVGVGQHENDGPLLADVAKLARMNALLQGSQNTLRSRFQVAVAKTVLKHKEAMHAPGSEPETCNESHSSGAGAAAGGGGAAAGGVGKRQPTKRNVSGGLGCCGNKPVGK